MMTGVLDDVEHRTYHASYPILALCTQDVDAPTAVSGTTLH